MYLLKRSQEALQRIRQLRRRRGQRHDRRAQDQKAQSHCHLDGKGQALFGDLKDASLPDHFTRRQEKIEHHCDQKKEYDRLHTSDNVSERYIGEHDHHREKQACQQISGKRVHHKQRDQIDKGSHKLHSGIESVQQGIRLIILSQCNCIKHAVPSDVS